MEKKKRVYMIGNSHIDPVWLWRWQEGFQEIKATFRSVLDRMKEYEEFIFTGSSASFYEWVEENDPEMFEEIKERVKEGRWVIVGGWWIQPDCNAPCGESFVRQGLYGQKYFEEKFGVKAICGYNVDSFGHNGNLPQILKKSGMDYYVFMRPGRHEKGIDGETFIWKSSDGSEVKAFRIPFEYCTWPEGIKEHVKRCAEEIKDPKNGIMCFYGVGNHGGGPTKKNIESIREMQQQEDMPELIFSAPVDYFKDVEKRGGNLPVVCGDLLHHASGCYSVESEIKMLNRKVENRLITAEKLSVMSKLLVGGKYPRNEYTNAWKEVLFNQFHDTLAGSCIKSAYDDAREGYGYALQIAAKGLNAAVQSMSWQIDIPIEEGMKPLVIFNSNSFETKAEVEVESLALKENTVLLDEKDRQIPYQLVQSEASVLGRCKIAFVAELPAMGWRTYRFAVREKQESFTDVISTENSAENKWFKITFDSETGYITSLIKKNDNTEYFSGNAAVPVVIQDDSDTWSHGIRTFHNEIGKARASKVYRVESGPVKCVIRTVSEYNYSRIIQDYAIYKELDFVKVHTTVDWHEKHKMLKLQFPMNMNYLRASYEIPYGVAQREPDGEEYPMQTWLDIEGAAPGLDTMLNGLTFFNDGKFAADVNGKLVELTILRSPVYAHHDPYPLSDRAEYEYVDQGIQKFTYGLYPHDGGWETADTVKRARQINRTPIALFETYHKGKLNQTGSFLNISEADIQVETIKEAEDGSGDIILRLLETGGKTSSTELSIPVMNYKIALDFTPYEIKTIRILQGNITQETNLLEEEYGLL